MERLLNEQEFNELVRQWGGSVRYAAQDTLYHGTSDSTHTLQNFLTLYVDESKSTHAAYKVKFQFERYGVFRHYGTGRGYKREGGVVKRVESAYYLEGLLKGRFTFPRKPLNWLDQHIERNISSLADVVQEYYGDRAMRHLLENFNNIKIEKYG